MTAINFPDSPSNGDTHVVGGVTYTYDSTETKWKTTINSNAFLPLTGGTVSGNIVLDGEIQHDGDTDTKLHFDTDTIKFDTAGSERFRVDSSGRLGIGTTSPATTFVVDKSDASGLSAHILINNSESSSGLSLLGAGSSFSSGGWPSLTDCGIIRSSAGSSNGVAIQAAAGAISFWNSSERARIDSSGRLLVGTSTATSSFKFGGSGDTATLAQFDGASSSRNVGLALVNHHTSDTQPVLRLAKSRGTAASPTVVSSSDYTGSIQFMGYDGTRYIDTARIDSQLDATPGTNDMPGRLVFSTTSDGGSVVTERLRIRANGNTEPGADNTYTIGTSASRWGSVWAANGTIQTSDERTKTQIANAHLGFEFIKSLRPVSYRWIEGGKRETGERNEDGTAIYESVPGERTHYGFIAQEVKEAVDAAGVDFGGWVLTDKDDPDSQQALRYDQFIAPLTKALQEAITKIETLETANASLEARLTALEGGAAQ
jgi:hypothetical protein